MPKSSKRTKRKLAFERAIARLRSSKLKVTPARTDILALLTRTHGPFRIEEIREKTKVDIVTIYRNLTTLEEARIVAKVDFGDNVSRYELRDPEFHHHHIICRKCYSVEEIDICSFEVMDKRLEEMGYSQVDHSVTFFAICQSCQPAASANSL